MIVWHAPLGKLISGHVLDVNVKGFQRVLTDLDDRLYVRWNPRKIKGHGCWEIRRAPGVLTAIHQATYKGADFYSLEYVENNLINHTLDCAFLNYDAIRKLQAMDTTNPKHWIHSLEYDEQVRSNTINEKADEARKYALRQHKTAMRDIYERVRSGENIHRILGETEWQMDQ